MIERTKDGVALIMPSDTVLHKPTGETWVVCGVDHDRGELIPCGYPFPTLAKMEDCELVEEHYSQEGQPESWVMALREQGYDRFVIKSELAPESMVEPDDNEPVFAPGTDVWVIDRDECGEPYDVSGVMFLADVCGYIIAFACLIDIDTAENTLEYCADETRKEFDTGLMVYPKSDCFFTQEAAHEAFNSYAAE